MDAPRMVAKVRVSKKQREQADVQSTRKDSTGSVPIDGEPAGAHTQEPDDAAGGPTRRNPFLDLFMPWKPGTQVVSRKPRGGQSRPAEIYFPIWAVAGGPPLEAMFLAADQICRNAFYLMMAGSAAITFSMMAGSLAMAFSMTAGSPAIASWTTAGSPAITFSMMG